MPLASWDGDPLAPRCLLFEGRPETAPGSPRLAGDPLKGTLNVPRVWGGKEIGMYVVRGVRSFEEIPGAFPDPLAWTSGEKGVPVYFFCFLG